MVLPVEADVLRLDRDPALALEVHRVEVLGAHVPWVDRPGQLEEPVGERRLPVVDVADDREERAADSSGSIVAILTHRGIGSGTVPC